MAAALTPDQRWQRRILAIVCALLWIVLTLMAYELYSKASRRPIIRAIFAALTAVPFIALIAFHGWARIVGMKVGFEAAQKSIPKLVVRWESKG